MGDMIGVAATVLAASQRKLELVSNNVANTGTAGFKKQVAFSEIIESLQRGATSNNIVSDNAANGALYGSALSVAPSTVSYTDYQGGALTMTGNPHDFALAGDGFFQVRADDGATFLTRHGQFSRLEDGRLVNEHGYFLQATGGRDIRLTLEADVLPDGVVLENGLPTGQIAVVQPDEMAQLRAVSGTLFEGAEAELELLDIPTVRQGMVEASNVVMADEMVTMMTAIREAEIGARIVQTYDNLMAQAISTFGQSR